jgi:hypothetical protein
MSWNEICSAHLEMPLTLFLEVDHFLHVKLGFTLCVVACRGRCFNILCTTLDSTVARFLAQLQTGPRTTAEASIAKRGVLRFRPATAATAAEQSQRAAALMDTLAKSVI